MLANIMGSKGGGGGGGGGGAAKSTAPPAKKWGAVDTGGSGGASSEAASALAAKLAPVASSGDDGTPPDISKYEKMAKMLPQGAVENAMTRDGVDPGWLFGADCLTVKSTKRPVKAGGGSAPSAAAHSQAAPAAAPKANPTGGQLYAPQQAGFPPQQAFSAPQQHQPQHMQQQRPQQFGEWSQMWSPEHSAYYYISLVTNQSTWVAPPGFGAVQPQHNFMAPAPIPQQNYPQLVTMKYPFNPTGANPLEMQVIAGDKIEIIQFGNDGWIVGRCQRS